MPLSLLTPAESLPVTTEEAKQHARVEVNADDSLIDGFIASATDYAEWYTERAIKPQQWELTLDRFPAVPCIELPRPPLISVEEITYIDAQGAEQTFASSNYRVETPRGPFAPKGSVVLLPGKSWPQAAYQQPVRIRFTAGYSGDHDEDAVPTGLKTAIQMHVAEQYENRESSTLTGAILQEVPFSVRQQLWPFVVDKL